MVRWAIMTIIILFAFISCRNNSINRNVYLEIGTYDGKFIRSSPNAKYAPSNVTLIFTAERFSGESDKIKYPVICKGTYKVIGQEIEFNNECTSGNEGEWSSILDGRLVLRVKGRTIEMTKHFGEYTDYYELTLQ